MLAKVTSGAIVGLEGAIVEVEADISPGLPSFTIVGLPDAAVQEARERVRAAIRNSACTFPTLRNSSIDSVHSFSASSWICILVSGLTRRIEPAISRTAVELKPVEMYEPVGTTAPVRAGCQAPGGLV